MTGKPRGAWVPVLVMLALVIWLNGYQHRHDAEAWLQRARTAATRLDFHGEQALRLKLPDRVLDARVSVAHEAPDRTRLDYLAPAELAGTIALCEGARCRRYDPRLGRTVEAQGDLTQPPAGTAGYRVHTGPGAPVAGRDTRRLSLKRRGTGRCDYWFDRETGLLLASRGPLAETRFTSFTVGRAPQPTSFELPAGAPSGQSLSLPELSRRLGFTVREPRWLPRGFARVDTALFTCPCCGMLAAQLVYRSAIGWLSLFEQGGDEACCLATSGGCATAKAHGGCLSGRWGTAPVAARLDSSPVLVAVGDASLAELQRVVGSVGR